MWSKWKQVEKVKMLILNDSELMICSSFFFFLNITFGFMSYIRMQMHPKTLTPRLHVLHSKDSSFQFLHFNKNASYHIVYMTLVNTKSHRSGSDQSSSMQQRPASLHLSGRCGCFMVAAGADKQMSPGGFSQTRRRQVLTHSQDM